MISATNRQEPGENSRSLSDTITLFLCGDVMTGRGIDQVLAHPSDPLLYEPYVKNAGDYVLLAERKHGPIPQPVGKTYIWGDTLEQLARVKPDLRIINLETSITRSDEPWPHKGINYRMHPANIGCLASACIDYCSLANNHVIDWGYPGLQETLETLQLAKIKYGGAGKNLGEARRPVVIGIEGKGRVIIFSYGLPSSGIPLSWAASRHKPGINLLENLSNKSVRHIRAEVESLKRQGDIVVISLHWGGNWGYPISAEHRMFAHQLIDEAGVDVIYGHSSHHVLGVEVYKGKPVLYGCGDFLNDYEGIGGYEMFRADLGLMYFVTIDPSVGKLLHLQMVPTRIQHFRVNIASYDEGKWLANVLTRESRKFGIRIERRPDNTLIVTD